MRGSPVSRWLFAHLRCAIADRQRPKRRRRRLGNRRSHFIRTNVGSLTMHFIVTFDESRRRLLNFCEAIFSRELRTCCGCLAPQRD